MKNLTFYSFLLAVSLLTETLIMAQVRFGAKAGVNVSSIALPLNGYGPRIGYKLGVMADIGLSSRFSIQPNLLFSSKGVVYKTEERDASGLYIETIRTKLNLNYLEVPILVVYKHPLRNGAKLFAGMGPYMGIGIFGYSKMNGYDKWKVSFDSNPRQDVLSFLPFDFGLSTSIGIETRKFSFGVDFNNGIKPLAHNTKNYNNTLSLTAGYFICR
ncbi:porin family protein [Persicitalea sp.]|uniref:porin family protein n=1 Tax=Persicitalea sp. TaxID=3100273 RepID=UPI00359427A0